MKRFISIILALVFLAGFATAQKYTKNPTYGKGGDGYKYGVKSHPVTLELTQYDKTVVGGDTTAALLKANKKFSFVAPFTCLIDSFWVCYSGTVTADTIATADTSSGLKIILVTGGGAATAPSTVAYACSTVKSGASYNTTALQLAAKLRANTVRYGTAAATVANRYLTAGEVYQVYIDTIGAGGSVIPRRLICGWNLVAPDK